MYGWYYSARYGTSVRVYFEHGILLAWDCVSQKWLRMPEGSELDEAIKWEK